VEGAMKGWKMSRTFCGLLLLVHLKRGHYSFWRLLLRGESVSCEQLL